jgi:hypothetical protein
MTLRPGDRHVAEAGLVLLVRFPEPWQADMFVSLLASEGIQSFLMDEHFVRNTKHSVAIGGVGVVVRESDAAVAWEILQRAERGELSLPEETREYADQWSQVEERAQKAGSPLSRELTGNREPETGAFSVVRCPRCGSAYSEKRKGIRALFSPGYRCRVCRWEWKEK